jgi:hypothetical protein
MSMLDFPVATGAAAHDAAVSLSEGTKANDLAAARAAYGGDPANYATYAAAIRAADIAHMRRVIASGAANGIAVPNVREGLRQLGVNP